jgi:hypothetical protein
VDLADLRRCSMLPGFEQFTCVQLVVCIYPSIRGTSQAQAWSLDYLLAKFQSLVSPRSQIAYTCYESSKHPSVHDIENYGLIAKLESALTDGKLKDTSKGSKTE